MSTNQDQLSNEPQTVGQILRRSASTYPDKTAVICGDGTTSFCELDELADAVARGLARRGVTKGSRVGVLMSNRPEYLAAYYGVARLAGVFVPIVSQSTVPELEYFVSHAGITFLLVDGQRWSTIGEGLSKTECFTKVNCVASVDAVDDESVVDWEDLLVRDGEPMQDAGLMDDISAFMYTSGSTGRPKAVVHSHRTVVRQVQGVSDRLEYGPDDVLMTVFPLFHGNALVWSAMTANYVGATLVLAERFSASRFWKDVNRHGVTAVNLLLGAANMLLAQPAAPDDRDNTLRLILSTVNPTVHEELTTRYGVDVVTLWAFAESPLGTMAVPGEGYHPGYIGRPMKGTEVSVIDDDFEPVPDGEVGELVVCSDAAMVGYHANEAETARVLRGGWTRSGDLGRRSSDGAFYFVGRIKHVIRRSGENISGEEVETVTSEHPEVVDTAVVSVPDDIRGEEMKAFIVRQAGSTLSERDLVAWLAERLSDFKIPRYIEFLDKLPRTGPQKVDLPALRARAIDSGTWDRTAGASLPPDPTPAGS